MRIFAGNLKGTKYSYGGEIKGLETDMVGTSSDPCIITDCGYSVITSSGWEYRKTNFKLRTIKYWNKDDTTEWMIKAIDSNTVHIWDVNPR